MDTVGSAALVSIPFIAGQWSLLGRTSVHFRGFFIVSIPFIAGQWSLLVIGDGGFDIRLSRFNPLHCGAVVASDGQ